MRGPNWIGDHVLALPFYEALRERYPIAELTLALPQAMKGVESFLPFKKFSWISDEERTFPKGALALGKRWRGEGFAFAFSIPSSWSSALALWSARIPHRIGFASGGSSLFLTHSIAWRGRDAGKHKSALYLDLLDSPPKSNWVAPAQVRNENRTIILAPGASLPLREWPYFVELALRLRAVYPQFELMLVGGPGETKFQSVFYRALGGKITDYIGKTDLGQLLTLLKSARLVVANDSGVAHLAATVALVPTVVLFGPGDPGYVLPLGERAVAVRVEDLPCSPCESSRCRAPFGYQRCLKDLKLDKVWVAIERVLR